MNIPNPEFLFPPRYIVYLRDLRDDEWARWIDEVNTSHPYALKRLAIELIVIRWSGCVNCQADSFRAMQGCIQCAIQAVRRYRGSCSDLNQIYSETIKEVGLYIDKGP